MVTSHKYKKFKFQFIASDRKGIMSEFKLIPVYSQICDLVVVCLVVVCRHGIEGRMN